jgi:hypothetical protein
VKGLGGHDSEPVEEIWECIDCEHDKELLPDSLAGFAFVRNLDDSATQDCRSLNKVYLIASKNH